MRLISQKQNRAVVPFLSLAGCAIALALLLAGCGWQSTTSSTKTGGQPSSGRTTPAQTQTAVNGQTPAALNSTGCPSNASASSATKANIVADVTHQTKPVEAHVGDLVELDLKFGQRWSGPKVAPTGLEMQEPAGFANQATKVCVWHFVAQKAGTFELDFEARALCKQGQMCAMYIMDNPVTLDVKN